MDESSNCKKEEKRFDDKCDTVYKNEEELFDRIRKKEGEWSDEKYTDEKKIFDGDKRRKL